MIAITFSVVVILALLSTALHWAMRIRLMRMDSNRDRIEWLSFRSGDDVLSAYQALFPGSVLPRFCRGVFWAIFVFAALGLCVVFTLKTLAR